MFAFSILQTNPVVLAQAGATGEGTFEGAGIVLVGFLFVIIVLAMLALVTAGIGAFFSGYAARESRKAAEGAVTAETEAPAADAGGEGIDVKDPEVLAVIAAAVHTVFAERPHRVVTVRTPSLGWAEEGRRQIFSSHRLR
ncbi:MAG: OadG family protein [Opitutales bacterium]